MRGITRCNVLFEVAFGGCIQGGARTKEQVQQSLELRKINLIGKADYGAKLCTRTLQRLKDSPRKSDFRVQNCLMKLGEEFGCRTVIYTVHHMEEFFDAILSFESLTCVHLLVAVVKMLC